MPLEYLLTQRLINWKIEMTTAIEWSDSKQTDAPEYPEKPLNLIFVETPPASVGFRFWDGTFWPDKDQRPTTLGVAVGRKPR